MPLLDVRGLTTHLFTDEGVVKAVDGVSLTLESGESVGIVGESGCGKSMLALSLMRLIPKPPGKIIRGSIFYQGRGDHVGKDLLKLTKRDMRDIRGKRLAMIFQEPMTSLNPLYTIGNQVGEVIALHEESRGREVRERTIDVLQLVGIPAPQKRMHSYPHELSGGMRQRVMIAMALACQPDILIADEPTTALDVTIQAQILELIAELREKFNMALLLITHDLGVVAEVTDRVIVMYAGQFVEEGRTRDIFAEPRHPYTQLLLRSLPPLEAKPQRMKMATIPGGVPQLTHLPRGCRFQDRCPKAQPRCRQEEVPDDPCRMGRLVRCFYADTASVGD